MKLSVTVNSRLCECSIEPRELLSDFLRERLQLTGTHAGCEHGACGACTVHLDGRAVRSCLVLACTCEEQGIVTIEGTRDDPLANALRRNFTAHHALQCGYCTPGMLMMAMDILRRHPDPNEEQIRHELSGQVCRCTGYQGIVDAILATARERERG